MKSESWLDMMRAFSPYIRRQKRLITHSFLALLVASTIRLLEPWPLAFAIDLVIGDLNKSEIIHLIGAGSLTKTELLWVCAGGVVAIAAIRAGVGFFSTVGMAQAGSQVLSDVRRDLFAHLLRLPLSFHQKAKTGDLTMRLINDIGMLREVTVTALVPMLSNVLILTGMLGIMFYLDWRLTLITLLPMPLVALSTLRGSQKIREVSRAQRKREGSLAARSAEYMAGIATIQAMHLDAAAMQTFDGDDRKSLQQNVRSKRLAAGMERRVDLLIALATSLVLLLGAKGVLEGKMSAGELLIFISYLKNAFRPVREFAKYSGRLSKAITAGERIVELLALRPAIPQRSAGYDFPSASKDVRFDEVCFSYPTEAGDQTENHEVLRGLSFCIPAGRSVAIIGPSGAGKSTLSQLLLRLYEPQSGRIVIGDHDIRDYNVASIRQQISYVPQESLLFGISIRENIALAAHDEVSDAEIVAAAQLANAHEFISALPEGYDTLVSERGSSLSGGQRQRISIARAAIRRSTLLLLDEPSVGLDSKNEHEVITALMRLTRNRTSLIITHNLAFAAQADYILVLDGGRIAEQGTPDELMALQGHYVEMLQLQQHP